MRHTGEVIARGARLERENERLGTGRGHIDILIRKGRAILTSQSDADVSLRGTLARFVRSRDAFSEHDRCALARLLRATARAITTPKRRAAQ